MILPDIALLGHCLILFFIFICLLWAFSVFCGLLFVFNFSIERHNMCVELVDGRYGGSGRSGKGETMIRIYEKFSIKFTCDEEKLSSSVCTSYQF